MSDTLNGERDRADRLAARPGVFWSEEEGFLSLPRSLIGPLLALSMAASNGSNSLLAFALGEKTSLNIRLGDLGDLGERT